MNMIRKINNMMENNMKVKKMFNNNKIPKMN